MKRNKIILTDAINDLTVVDRMMARRQMKEAQDELYSIFAYATQVRGGDSEIRDLMDKFQAEFGKRYAVAYAK